MGPYRNSLTKRYAPPTGKAQPAPRALDPQQAERIKRIMGPLVAAVDHPRPLSQVQVGIMDDPHVNAASAGGGEFYVTTGLLQKANDEQLRGGHKQL